MSGGQALPKKDDGHLSPGDPSVRHLGNIQYNSLFVKALVMTAFTFASQLMSLLHLSSSPAYQ
jgi:hypothetical protein